jgi:hypothetical protein
LNSTSFLAAQAWSSNEVRLEPATGLFCRAHQSAAEEISKRFVLDGAHHLAPRLPERGQHLDKMQRPEVIDVLNRVVFKRR